MFIYNRCYYFRFDSVEILKIDVSEVREIVS